MDSSEQLYNALILTKCNNKEFKWYDFLDRHKLDKEILREVKEEFKNGLKRAYFTDYKDDGIRYCIGIEFKGDKKSVLRMFHKLSKDPRINAVQIYSIPDIPLGELIWKSGILNL